jgi:hypothetical protein
MDFSLLAAPVVVVKMPLERSFLYMILVVILVDI